MTRVPFLCRTYSLRYLASDDQRDAEEIYRDEGARRCGRHYAHARWFAEAYRVALKAEVVR